MTTLYNRIAGSDLERLSALSDGVFAFAMTLLVLDLKVPALDGIHSERDLVNALLALSPRFLTWLMSVITLGIFWVGQQTQHTLLARSDRGYVWIHIVFLMGVTLVPFSTALLGSFITYRTALLVYWANILILGLTLLHSWLHARKFGLVKKDAPQGVNAAVMRRIWTAQILYTFGAALCLFSNWWSIGFIIALQLSYAIAPRFRPFSWL